MGGVDDRVRPQIICTILIRLYYSDHKFLSKKVLQEGMLLRQSVLVILLLLLLLLMIMLIC